MDMLCKEIFMHTDIEPREYFHDRGRETIKSVLLLYSCTASIRSMIGCLWKATYNVVWAATKIAHVYK